MTCDVDSCHVGVLEILIYLCVSLLQLIKEARGYFIWSFVACMGIICSNSVAGAVPAKLIDFLCLAQD